MVDTTVCLLAPKTILPAEALSRFTAEHPDLQVRWVEYQEPNELRRARVLGTVTPELQELEPQLTDEDRAALRSAVAVVALDLPTEILELAPNLRFVQAVGAGIEWLLARRLDHQGVVLTNASGVASASIAEFVIGRLLEVWKDIRLIESQQRERVWRPRWAGEMAGRTLGVVGLGAIGRATAVRARAFDMRVLATRRRFLVGEQVDPDVDRMFPLDQLDDMLGLCDAVLLSAPSTVDTADLFNAERFAAMRPGSVFVNVSRGSLVDEPALVEALRSGHLAAAIIDVAKQEPAPPEHPFWDTPNLYLSPHCSASLELYPDRLFELFVDNLGRLQRDEPLRNIVDAERGY
jgi:phosphoglycerate dehydrogenase-like enzyme